MSYRPNAPAGKLPTLHAACVFQQARSSGSSSPHEYFRESPPLAAYSHSASCGRRAPRKVQYFAACSKSTQFTGWSSRVRLDAVQVTRSAPEGLQAPAATHSLYAPSVTSVRSRQKAANRVRYLGHSSDAPSPLVEPIHASPAGIFAILAGHSGARTLSVGGEAVADGAALVAGRIRSDEVVRSGGKRSPFRHDRGAA